MQAISRCTTRPAAQVTHGSHHSCVTSSQTRSPRPRRPSPWTRQQLPLPVAASPVPQRAVTQRSKTAGGGAVTGTRGGHPSQSSSQQLPAGRDATRRRVPSCLLTFQLCRGRPAFSSDRLALLCETTQRLHLHTLHSLASSGGESREQLSAPQGADDSCARVSCVCPGQQRSSVQRAIGEPA